MTTSHDYEKGDFRFLRAAVAFLSKPPHTQLWVVTSLLLSVFVACLLMSMSVYVVYLCMFSSVFVVCLCLSLTSLCLCLCNLSVYVYVGPNACLCWFSGLCLPMSWSTFFMSVQIYVCANACYLLVLSECVKQPNCILARQSLSFN